MVTNFQSMQNKYQQLKAEQLKQHTKNPDSASSKLPPVYGSIDNFKPKEIEGTAGKKLKIKLKKGWTSGQGQKLSHSTSVQDIAIDRDLS